MVLVIFSTKNKRLPKFYRPVCDKQTGFSFYKSGEIALPMAFIFADCFAFSVNRLQLSAFYRLSCLLKCN
jgi:hypothetical protein